MKLPIMYDIKCPDEKAGILRKIYNKLSRLPVDDFPYICGQLENDNAKVDLIDLIIQNMYGTDGGKEIDTVINSIEMSLKGE